ncbi:MAG TPA: hypothetical protein VFL83_22190 [Anaeromyxobacter sp.]|nr:hypothetical protein [Anaeromyxobacter sp.]
MGSRILWAAIVAAVVAFTIGACSGSPGEAVDPGMTWDQSSWDSSNWN